ncbi:APC family permease [Arthrobacter sp. 8AJ]|uniref:APC family permease n=1 Tax=Arthrobacter sp. 8AJ TaxID=2653130 RepID=UPI001F2946FD|nr:APC family permease [Arthrobacter sp. 8AJ]
MTLSFYVQEGRMATKDVKFEPVDAGPNGILSPDRLLSRGLGVRSIVFMVVAGAAPMTAVVAGWPVVVSASGSTGGPLFFLIATAILFLFAVGFTRMTPFVKNAGAFYSYIQTGLGRGVGMGAATFALGTYLLLFLALCSYLGSAAQTTVHDLGGPELPWWLCSLVLMATCGALAYRDVELSAKVLGVVLVIETVVLLAVNIGVIVHGGAEGLSADSLSPARLGEGVPPLGVMFAFFSFIGFEATAVFRNEARDPDRTIPRATYIAVIGVGIFYTFTAWALQAGVGSSQIVEVATNDPTSIVVGLAGQYVSPLLATLLQVFLITSLFACILTFQNVLTRYLFTLGTQGVLPSGLGAIHPRHHAPSRAALIVSVVAIALLGVEAIIGLDPVTQAYTWFSGSATLGIVVLMALTSLAVIVFFRRNAHNKKVWGTLLAPALALLGLGGIVFLVLQNFGLLVGGDLAAGILLTLMAALFLGGVTTALVMRSKRPATYAALIPAGSGSEESSAGI